MEERLYMGSMGKYPNTSVKSISSLRKINKSILNYNFWSKNFLNVVESLRSAEHTLFKAYSSQTADKGRISSIWDQRNSRDEFPQRFWWCQTCSGHDQLYCQQTLLNQVVSTWSLWATLLLGRTSWSECKRTLREFSIRNMRVYWQQDAFDLMPTSWFFYALLKHRMSNFYPWIVRRITIHKKVNRAAKIQWIKNVAREGGAHIFPFRCEFGTRRPLHKRWFTL